MFLIARAPYRISLFGGGTDYPDWFKVHGGKTLSFAINKYCYVFIKELPPYFDYNYRVRYYDNEEVNEVSQILHPVVREAYNLYNIKIPLDFVHSGDLPARSGIGSSSAFSASVLMLLSHYTGKQFVSKKRLAEATINFEQNILSEVVGCQDQISSCFGGINIIDYFKNGDFSVRPLPWDENTISKFEKSCFLAFSGIQRTASELANETVEAFESKTNHIHKIQEKCVEAVDLLSCPNPDFYALGKMLFEQWRVKKEISAKISNSKVNSIIDFFMNNGAFGCKLMGAGGGGFILVIADAEKVPEMRRLAESHRLKTVDVKLDYNGVSLSSAFNEQVR